MRRFVGQARRTTPGPTLDDASRSMDGRVEVLDQKIAKLDAELLKYRQQMRKMRTGPSQQAVKQRAMKVLQQKKMYENQREQLYAQSFNVDQAAFAVQSMKDTHVQVQAMASASKALKKGFKKVNIDKVENIRDSLEELMEDSSEISDILSRSYGVPDEIDEDELEAELEGLELELDDEAALAGGGNVPSYLSDAPAVPSGPVRDTEEAELEALRS